MELSSNALGTATIDFIMENFNTDEELRMFERDCDIKLPGGGSSDGNLLRKTLDLVGTLEKDLNQRAFIKLWQRFHSKRPNKFAEDKNLQGLIFASMLDYIKKDKYNEAENILVFLMSIPVLANSLSIRLQEYIDTSLKHEPNWKDIPRVLNYIQSRHPTLDIYEGIMIQLVDKLRIHISSMLQKKSWNESLDLLQQLNQQFPNETHIVALIDKHPNQIYAHALEALHNGQWDVAEELIKNIYETYSSYPSGLEGKKKLEFWRSLYEKACASWARGDWDEAASDLKALQSDINLNDQPNTKSYDYKDSTIRLDLLAQYERGFSFLKSHEYSQAVEQFTQLQHSPIGKEMLELRLNNDITQQTDLLIKNKDFVRAYQLFSEFRHLSPNAEELIRQIKDRQRPAELYEKAMQAWEAQDWDLAQQLFDQIDPASSNAEHVKGYLDQLKKWQHSYAAARNAWDRAEWQQVETLLKQLVLEQGTYKYAQGRLAVLQHYRDQIAQARVLVDQQLFEQAERIFEHIHALLPGYEDAESFRIYAHARRLINQRHWDQAVICLTDLQNWNTEQFVAEQTLAEINRLQKTIRHLQTGLICDTEMQWPQGYPYLVLQDAGFHEISPSASIETVRAYASSIEHSRIPTAQSSAWRALGNNEQRIVIDVLLYPAERSNPMIHFLEQEFAKRLRLPSAEALIEEFGIQAAEVLLLWGDHERAIRLLEEAQRLNLNNTRLAHQLALLSLARADELTRRNRYAEAMPVWLAAIGQWAMVLTDQIYWDKWLRERSLSYKELLLHYLPALPALLEAQIREQLLQSTSPHRERLVSALQAEISAVRLLRGAEIGGIPTERFGFVYCGPQLIGKLDIASELAYHVAAQDVAEDNHEARRLRWFFSDFRLPAALMESPHLDPRPGIPMLNESLSGNYDVYCKLSDPPATRSKDEQRLRAALHFAIASYHINVIEEWDYNEISAHWQASINQVRAWNGEAELKARISSLALERANELGSGSSEHPDLRRLNHAVQLLEAAIRLTLAPASQHLATENLLIEALCIQLCRRGVYNFRQDDYSESVRDLEQAYKLWPTQDVICDWYGTALVYYASEMYQNNSKASVELLMLAKTVVEKGRKRNPTFKPYHDTYNLITEVRRRIDENDKEE
jgi:outer membrane protein assembly factor BamD (BamD/ComL family)